MSKIIFFNHPSYGCVNPTLPVVQELIRRGEQVIYYNTSAFQPDIERTGATFRAYPASELTSISLSELLKEGNGAGFVLQMLHNAETLLPYAIEELSREQPDLVVFDLVTYWGWIAAVYLKLKMAASIPTFVLEFDTVEVTQVELFRAKVQLAAKSSAINGVRERINKRYDLNISRLSEARGGLNLVYTARQFQPDAGCIDHTYRFVGPCIDNYIRPEETLFPDLTGVQRPVVYISLGTIHHLNIEFYKTCFEAFADYPAQFVVSIGKQNDVSALGDIPANFIARSSVPRLKVLERANAFFTHAGLNSVHEGLFYSVPLISVPQHIEHLLNARVVERHGAGVTLEHHFYRRRLPAADLRAALEEVLSQPRYREGARNVQAMLRATGGYQQAADEIQAYIARS